MNSDDRAFESSRFERKYRCPLNQYLAIRSSLYPFLKNDHFTKRTPDNKYLVRSLYFDTFDYRLFQEKINGNSNRIKFRIRTYSNSPKNEPDIRVEIKVRQANLTTKYGAYINLSNCCSFINSRNWDNKNDPILIEFERQVHKLNLIPKTLVEYEREGFHTIDGNNIRITFDHRIRSTSAKDLFPENIFWHLHYDQMVVLEIKYQETIPNWLNQIIKNHKLKLVANSKFVNGIHASCPDLIYPSWNRI